MDDNVSDTPNSKGWTSCNLDGESCGSLDNVQNYLEYAYCGRMFTEGQKTRLRTAALSTVSDRDELSTTSNLIATGVEGDPILCEAIFTTSQLVICAGDSILFYDNSYHDVDVWSWNFGDGATLSGSESGVHDAPYHTFNVEGIYEVVLTVSNSIDDLDSEAVTITVLPAGAMDSPAVQGFESDEFPSEDWFREDPFDDGGWELDTEVGFTGSRSLHIENWGNTIEFNKDFLISSTMDLSQDIVEVRVSYKWAYCYKGFDDEDETDDRLRVSVTGDCGNDWDLRKMHRGLFDLPSAEAHYYPFIPESNSEWNSHTLTLDQSIYLTPHFRVMFEFESRLGNDIYLDDINITAYTQEMIAVQEWNFGPSWALHPNPSEGVSQLNCTTVSEHQAKITLVDASGRLVEAIYSGQLPAGPHNFEISPADKRRGTYFVVIELDGKPKALPWIIK
jgi:PKD repeat protein